MHTQCKIKLLADNHETISLVTKHLSGHQIWVPNALLATSFCFVLIRVSEPSHLQLHVFSSMGR